MTDRARVLVTGAAGQIGGIIRSKLAYRCDLVGLDIVDCGWPESHVADLGDIDSITPAFEGVDVVVHMGADPSPQATWESTLSNNIVGTRNVYEAARLAGARRVILASTNHAVGFYPLKDDPYKAIYDGRLAEVRRPFRMLDDRDLRPDSLYGVSKAFGESLGSYYHDQYELSIICLRIGWVMTPDDPTFHPAALSLWLSHRDAAQLIQKAIDAPPSVGFAIVYGMSRNDLRIWDIEAGERIIGFSPEDGSGEEWTPVEGARGFMG
ncbi:MAG: NAD(P)-dependent oxidoreductase [Dehalococcoidia bacterium]|nr:NAD(P)-dependent oxidoreductase [Dehalococcoidia bacterium]